jgi:ech hydrogenase subunit D
MCTTCSDVGGGFEVLYHFDRDLALRNLSVNVTAGDTLPSITDIYACAFLVENEMHDLFGLAIEGISIDYQGRLLISDAVDASPVIKQREEQVK